MPTPTTAFADAAAKYGDVDPNDIEAVERWFTETLLTLPAITIEQVFQDLLEQDGAIAAREIAPVYPKRAPLPSLGSSPEAAFPRLADLKTLFRRLRSLARTR